MPDSDHRPFLGLVTALDSETRALCGGGKSVEDGLFLRRELETPQGRVVCLQCGPGPERSLAAARELAERGALALLCAGVSSGLDPEARSGRLLLSSRVFLAHKNEPLLVPLETNPLGPEAAERVPGLRREPDEPTLLTTAAPLLDPEQKTRWRELTGALAVDMESAGVALAAREAGLPFLALRAVGESVTRPLSRSMIEACDGKTAGGALPLLGAMLRRPSLVRDFWRAGRDYSRALNALEKAGEEVFAACFLALAGASPIPGEGSADAANAKAAAGPESEPPLQ